MIQEQYVSFETAKLLKEKGFDEPCIRHWDYDDNNIIGADDLPLTNSELEANEYPGCAAPSQSMAMRWLREVHNINIVVEPHSHNGFKAVEYEIMYWHEGHYHVPYQESHPTYHPLYGKTWNTYEEACEAAIRYCLEHLI